MKFLWYVTFLIVLLVVSTSPETVAQWKARYQIAFEQTMTEHYCIQQAQYWECENHE